jgi:hypothetical protein
VISPKKNLWHCLGRHPRGPGNAGPRQAHHDRVIHARVHQPAEAGLAATHPAAGLKPRQPASRDTEAEAELLATLAAEAETEDEL